MGSVNAPSETGRFVHIESDLRLLDFASGLAVRPLVGKRLLASFVRYEPDAVAPLHSHKEEQVLIVVERELELELDGQRRMMRPGDAAVIPAFVPHQMCAVAGPAHEIDVFSPPRGAMLELLKQYASHPDVEVGTGPVPDPTFKRSKCPR